MNTPKGERMRVSESISQPWAVPGAKRRQKRHMSAQPSWALHHVKCPLNSTEDRCPLKPRNVAGVPTAWHGWVGTEHT